MMWVGLFFDGPMLGRSWPVHACCVFVVNGTIEYTSVLNQYIYIILIGTSKGRLKMAVGLLGSVSQLGEILKWLTTRRNVL